MRQEPAHPETEALAGALVHAERQLTLEEFEAFLRSESSDEALAEKQSLIDWFTRRYSTPAARSAYGCRYGQAVRKARRSMAPPRSTG